MEYNQNGIEIELDPHSRVLIDNLLRSIRFVYMNDSYLLDNNVHEQALSHRLAYYFENICQPEYYNKDIHMTIDTEYNKNFDHDKEVFDSCGNCNNGSCFIKRHGEKQYSFEYSREGHRAKYQTSIIGFIQQNESKKTRPDIILHHRGSNGYNRIVIETKRNISFGSADDIVDLVFDFLKLSYYTCHPHIENNRYIYRFMIGCSLLLSDHHCDILIFRNGDMINTRYRLTCLHDDFFCYEAISNDDIKRALRLEQEDGA